MSQSTITYEATVYSRDITYRNLHGETKTVNLTFALSPIDLMAVVSRIPTNKSKSRDPRKAGQNEGITDEQRITLVQDLAAKSAGFISENGETFSPWEGFANDIVGQAFLTKLVSSDADRQEFAEKVILAPFRAFVDYARADESNSAKDIQEIEGYLAELEKAFSPDAKPAETNAERRARIQAELAALPADES